MRVRHKSTAALVGKKKKMLPTVVVKLLRKSQSRRLSERKERSPVRPILADAINELLPILADVQRVEGARAVRAKLVWVQEHLGFTVQTHLKEAEGRKTSSTGKVRNCKSCTAKRPE